MKSDFLILVSFLIGIKPLSTIQREALIKIFDSHPTETTLKELFHACLSDNLSNYNLTMEQINNLIPLCDAFEKAVGLPNLDIVLEEAKKFQQLLNYTE
ncbi:TPA: hypothetical protein I8Y83_002750 [Legionella pneumophila]|uniref:Uncharacterized protein n=2 Tax=Legionella bozemanae TaxID=447 RepID=A0A0W0RF08_LEGBO|nr:hypothetical protein [Legionella bozemanae]KTC69575.1 hypothetical protein Lboz_3091 [Legionella bozemanae]STP13853.1 Uncharacterised protein [Legionella bozemanae]HAT1722199.1 hypothetical protein [Legionella pneumophila]